MTELHSQPELDASSTDAQSSEGGLDLSGKQKRHLRGLAHGLKPLALLGKQGLTEAFLESLEHTLSHHELVKVKFLDWKEEKKDLGDEMASRLGCAVAGRVGHHVLLYRPAEDPRERKIRLPR